MGHEEYLVSLLRPLGVYDLGSKAINRGELAAYGNGLDTVLAKAEDMIREMSLVTAENTGLDMVESLLPYRPASGTTEERRRALAALLRIGGDSFTLSAINDTLSGCGVYAKAHEGKTPGCVEVTFPDTPGIPAAFDQLKSIIEEIIPCHLEISYQFRYNTWEQVAALLVTWGNAEATGMSWAELAAWIA